MTLRNLSPDFILDWAMQTGMAVTVLIFLVLVIRRPFAKAFGARAAYALWALPLMRIFLPTVTIPNYFLPWINPLEQVGVPVSYLPPEIKSVAASLPVSQGPDLPLISLIIWLGGTALFLIYHVIRHKYARRLLLKNGLPASTSVLADAYNAARELDLSQRPSLFLSSENDGPMVMGVFSPVVILPRGRNSAF